MPRGRKKALPLRDQLDNVIIEISKTEERLKELKEQKKDIENQIKNQQLVELNDFIEKSGVSIDDIKNMINKEG